MTGVQTCALPISLVLGSSCATRSVADELGRDKLSGRHRTRTVDRPLQSRCRAVQSRSSITISRRRIVGGSIGSTWVFNAGRQYGRPPTHIILDSAHETALWFSEAGNQFVGLDQTPIRVEDLTEVPAWLKVKVLERDPSRV